MRLEDMRLVVITCTNVVIGDKFDSTELFGSFDMVPFCYCFHLTFDVQCIVFFFLSVFL